MMHVQGRKRELKARRQLHERMQQDNRVHAAAQSHDEACTLQCRRAQRPLYCMGNLGRRSPRTSHVRVLPKNPSRGCARGTRLPIDSPQGHFLELAEVHELGEARLQQILERLFLHLLERVLQGFAERLHHDLGIAMRAAQRLGHDLVDQP